MKTTNSELKVSITTIKLDPYFTKLNGTKAPEILACCSLEDKEFNKYIEQLKSKLTNISETSHRHLSIIIKNLINIHNLITNFDEKEYIISEAKKWAEELGYKDALKTKMTDNQIAVEIEDNCTKLQFFLSRTNNGGAEIISSCALPNDKEEFFLKICASIINHSKSYDLKQQNLAEQTVKILNFLRSKAINDELVRNYIIKRALEAAELSAISNYMEGKPNA